MHHRRCAKACTTGDVPRSQQNVFREVTQRKKINHMSRERQSLLPARSAEPTVEDGGRQSLAYFLVVPKNHRETWTTFL